MFTPEFRSSLRSNILELAADDRRISGGAITGSLALDREDTWSDVDLAFGVTDPAEMPNVIADFTEQMYRQYQVVHHFDVISGAWIYRVFLLPNTLQVDLAFVPASEFRAMAASFRLIFGKANEPRQASPASAENLIGNGWLYALHVRSSLARNKLWQAEYFISGIRNYALALACLRHKLPTAHGRGLHQLPDDVTAPFEDSLVRSLDPDELARAFRSVVSAFLTEIRYTDAALEEKLRDTVTALTASPY